ncbi:hypothetical protein [Coxiella endosymbiont of Ornithodoros maritimus]|nr:hypothetical protein [Coxiella endosymbiont of Ornithodoros maritimus]
MPYGLALSANETILYIGDTGAIDGKNPYNPRSAHDIFSAYLKTSEKID